MIQNRTGSLPYAQATSPLPVLQLKVLTYEQLAADHEAP